MASAARALTGDLGEARELGELKDLQPAIRSALGNFLAIPGHSESDKQVDESEQSLPLGHWQPVPRGVDVAVRHQGAEHPCYTAELKLRKTDETLWDLFKMVDAVRSCGVTCAYLLVGAREDDWLRSEMCTEPFRLAPLMDYPSVNLFADNKKAWLNLLQGGSARPTSIPTRVSTYPVASCKFPIDGAAGSLRCVRVHPSGTVETRFDPRWCCGDWPSGVEAPAEYFDWKRSHWRFLRVLERHGGSGTGDELRGLARQAGFNLDREKGLYYSWEPMLIRRGSTRELTPAGRRFLHDWGYELGS